MPGRCRRRSMPDDPREALDRGIRAVGAVADLLCSVGHGDLHTVDPDRFCSLLELIHRDLRQASDGLVPGRRPA